jgi:hypothetical protein
MKLKLDLVTFWSHNDPVPSLSFIFGSHVQYTQHFLPRVGDPKRLPPHESISCIWHYFVDKIPTTPEPPPDWDASLTAPRSLFLVMELFPLSLQVLHL